MRAILRVKLGFSQVGGVARRAGKHDRRYQRTQVELRIACSVSMLGAAGSALLASYLASGPTLESFLAKPGTLIRSMEARVDVWLSSLVETTT